MKVFISWSGEESGAVAQVLRTQLPCIINAVKPFVSSEDIEKGAAWFQSIGAELEKSDFGILCLTSANQNSKWVQFEAGALAGKFSKARVAPLLIDTTPASIKPPLSQFQLTELNNREDFYKLLVSINAGLGENALQQEILKESFENWWNTFHQKVKTALEKIPKNKTKQTERSEKEILGEVLSLTRSIAAAMPPVAYNDGLSGLWGRQVDIYGNAVAPGYIPVPRPKGVLNFNALLNQVEVLPKSPSQESE